MGIIIPANDENLNLMVNVSEELLADVLGTTVEEITKSLKDGETLKPQEDVDAFLRQSFDGLTAKVRHKFKKEGYSWGEKESLTKKGKELKEKFGVEGDTIDEIVDAVIEQRSKKSQLSPDDVRNSEIFQSEVKKLKDIIKQKDEDLSNQKNSFEKSETLRLAKEYGLKFLKEKNYVLDDDADILEEKLENLFSKLEDDSTRLSREGSKIIILDQNGRPKENEQGTKELSYEDLLGLKAKRYFKQAVADNRKSPANKNKEEGGNDNTPDVPEMKSADDYYKAMDQAKDFETKKAIKASYDQMVKDGKIQ